MKPADVCPYCKVCKACIVVHTEKDFVKAMREIMKGKRIIYDEDDCV